MPRPLRQLLVGTLMVLASSAIAIVGAVRREPTVLLVGVAMLTLILVNEVLGTVWEPPLAAPLRWWRRLTRGRRSTPDPSHSTPDPPTAAPDSRDE